MDSFKPKRTRRDGPESVIQKAIISMLESKGWIVKSTHGSEFQSGFPDLYVAHRSYGSRWIEIKNPLAYCFTPAQIDWFGKMNAAGVGIWILVAATEEEYKKLFRPANWIYYLKECR